MKRSGSAGACLTSASPAASTSSRHGFALQLGGRARRSERGGPDRQDEAAAADGARGYIEREHPYDLPAILILALSSVNESYGDWLLARISAVAWGEQNTTK
jgi:hypothetical protein